MVKGKLIVIEGTDGAGKTTQFTLLSDYLTNHHIPFETLDFPQYDKTFFGEWIGRFLNGEFGNLSEIPPYLLAFPYAADRWQAKEEIRSWLAQGKLVLTNRYVSSNAVYQGAKLPREKREAFIKWCFQMEYEVFGVPKEDLVIYLHLPMPISQGLIEQKHKRSYLKNGNNKDLHESNPTLLAEVEKVYLKLAAQNPHWVKIDCYEGDKMLDKLSISKKILEVLRSKGIVI